MPCFDAEPSYEKETLKSRHDELSEKLPGILCSLTQKLGFETIVATVDWENAGVSVEEYREWWALHQTKDIIRTGLSAAP